MENEEICVPDEQADESDHACSSEARVQKAMPRQMMLGTALQMVLGTRRSVVVTVLYRTIAQMMLGLARGFVH